MGNKPTTHPTTPPNNIQKDEFNFFEKYPRCDASDRPDQSENDCYAASLVYSLRNCVSQYPKISPSADDVMVRTVDHARMATFPDGRPCGNGHDGGHSSCVLGYFERTDKNKAKQLTEKEVEQELNTKGPVLITFNTGKDFFDQVQNSEEPYKLSERILGRHAATVIGFGKTNTGEKYWLCHDSNKTNDGNFINYRLPQENQELNSQFFTTEILRPLPISEKKQQNIRTFITTGERPITRFCTGALRDDAEIMIQSGLKHAHDEWLKKMRTNNL